jgi:predicted acyltransferase
MGTKLSGERLLSLDAFRGATIAAMILVNNGGDWLHTYWPLQHAPWHGWTPTDLIFPFFLFMVGMSLTFSKRGTFVEALKRALKLIGLGLLIYAFPFTHLAHLRWLGVLQRIGLCYLAAWLVKRWLRWPGQAVLAVALLAGYWLVMTRVIGPEGYPPNLEANTNLAAQVDRIFLTGHMWGATKTWDPEGLLSTLPAIATVLLGLLAGEWVRSSRSGNAKTSGLLAAGLLLTLAGHAWNGSFPINKNLWTSSFVLWTGGLGAYLFGLTYWVVDVRGHRAWARPFVVYGRNAIAVYVAAEFLAEALWSVKWTGPDGAVLSLHERIFQSLLASWLPPHEASFLWALAAVFLMYLLALWMDRRGIYLKV